MFGYYFVVNKRGSVSFFRTINCNRKGPLVFKIDRFYSELISSIKQIRCATSEHQLKRYVFYPIRSVIWYSFSSHTKGRHNAFWKTPYIDGAISCVDVPTVKTLICCSCIIKLNFIEIFHFKTLTCLSKICGRYD